MYIKRNIEKTILENSKNYPVIMVCGQSQVGKSIMLNYIKEANRKYVSFNDWMTRKLATEDPSLFFEKYKPPFWLMSFKEFFNFCKN